MTSSPEDRHDIDLALADWLAKLGGPDAGQYRQPFALWLDEGPEHRTAYAAFQATAREVGMTSLPTPELHVRTDRTPSPFTKQLALAAAVVLVVGGVGALGWRLHNPGSAPATVQIAAEDEPRAIDLPEGPSMMLDAHAVILTSLNPSLSTLTLLGGRGRFRLPAQGSPFVVAAGSLRVTARGAVFDIVVDGDIVRVTVLRGRVLVRHRDTSANSKPVTLDKGHQLVADTSGDRVIAAARGEAGWSSALLPLDGKTLADVIAIGNRRGGKPVLLADPVLSGRLLQGQAPATDTHILALQLAAAFDLDLRETEQGYVLSIKS